MPSTVKSTGGGKDFEPVRQGTHAAVCCTVVNLGMQETHFGTKAKHYIAFQVPDQRVKWEDKDGVEKERPAHIGATYTSSLSEKANLRKDLESWRGKTFTEAELQGFDLFNLLGKPCMLSITHNQTDTKIYANISAIMGLPAGMPAPQVEGEIIRYDPNDSQSTPIDQLPNWMQEKIKPGGQDVYRPQANSENPAPTNPNTPIDDYDDIPF